MLVLVALAFALMLWVVAWSFGVHAVDGFMVVLAILLLAFTARVLTPFVRRQLGRE